MSLWFVLTCSLPLLFSHVASILKDAFLLHNQSYSVANLRLRPPHGCSLDARGFCQSTTSGTDFSTTEDVRVVSAFKKHWSCLFDEK